MKNEAKKTVESEQFQTSLQFADLSQLNNGSGASGGGGGGGGGGDGGSIGMTTPLAKSPIMSAKKWWEEDMEEEAAYHDALEEAESSMTKSLRRESVADRLSSLLSQKSKETGSLDRTNNSLN